ncbi:MAG: OmpA family protein [Verrucomicrobiota bacterium]|nr:OmpA family protein [Verrucomicrobiota bacterium]
MEKTRLDRATRKQELQAQLDRLTTEAESARESASADLKALRDRLAEREGALETMRKEEAKTRAHFQNTKALLKGLLDRHRALREQAERRKTDPEAQTKQLQALPSTTVPPMRPSLPIGDGSSRATKIAAAAVILAVCMLGAFYLGYTRPGARESAPGPASRTAAVPTPTPPPSAVHSPAARPPTPCPTASLDLPPMGHSAPATAVSARTLPTINIPRARSAVDGESVKIVFESGLFSSMTNWAAGSVELLRTAARQVAPHLNSYDLIVEGHTDNTTFNRGSPFEDNEALALMRAETVLAFLISAGGLPAESLRAVAEAEEDAPYPNDTATNRERNRTVVLWLSPKR